MDKIRIVGGRPLQGRIRVSGAKNAALPIFFASLLTDQPSNFDRAPKLQDIRTTLKLLEMLGASTDSNWLENKVCINPAGVNKTEAPYDLVRTMRASVLCLGPLLAKHGKARVSLPGGCAIGARPINFHLEALKKLGATIELAEGYVEARCAKLQGARIRFDFPSVGATENILMAATLASGDSVLENCAQEPEIVDLANCLRSMGAHIEGDGTPTIRVQGKANLNGAQHEIIGDRIEAGTFLAAALATRGDVTVEGIDPQWMDAVLKIFENSGAQINRYQNAVRVVSPMPPAPVNVTTQPHPGFPTDMQAQLMAALCTADGTSTITETVFENRFMHVPELTRLGAQISIRGNTATIVGLPKTGALKAAPLMATDLRASASLIIAALCAQGETIVNRVYHLDRGYSKLEEKLRALGADITRIK